jgi:hypothetical protein
VSHDHKFTSERPYFLSFNFVTSSRDLRDVNADSPVAADQHPIRAKMSTAEITSVEWDMLLLKVQVQNEREKYVNNFDSFLF